MAGDNEPKAKWTRTCKCPKCQAVIEVTSWRKTIEPPKQGEYEDWVEATMAEQQELPGLGDDEPKE